MIQTMHHDQIHINQHCLHDTTEGLVYCCKCRKAEVELSEERCEI